MYRVIPPPPRIKFEGNGLYRIFVRSDRDEDQWYLVDLLENKPTGWCGCEDFEYNRKKGLTKAERPCKHIRIAIEELGKIMVERARKIEWRKEIENKVRLRKKTV